MYRVVLDTVVFVRALINPKSRSGRLLTQHADRYTLIVSRPTAQELLEVIRRPELTEKYSSLGTISPKEIIDIVAQAEAVDVRDPPAVVRDPKDDIIVATAIAGQADYIVSEDNDLLDMGEVSGIAIVDTKSFLELLESTE